MHSANKNLPHPPKLLNTIGPSFILLGLALGSGELIMWPYLTATWGLGLIWGAFLGISFQYVLNLEIMRYTLAWGESVFVGFRKLAKWLPFWFIISTIIPWSLPGFSSASSQILASLLHFPHAKLLAIIILLLTGTVLTLSESLHHTMEFIQRTIILIGLPFILLLVLILTNQKDWIEVGLGLIGKGQNWWFFPPGVALASFLGAFAYAGAGGNLNFAQSYYIKEKGFGMGKFAGKITSLFSPGDKVVEIEGKTFSDTKENFFLWKKWWRVVATEHFIVFWFLGLITIIALAVLSKSLVFGHVSQASINFLYQEGGVIAQKIGPLFSTGFLLVASLMLLSTQIGVLESSSRIISENLLLISFRSGKTANPSKAFYITLWIQILIGIVVLLLGFEDPRLLLTLAAVLNAIAMTVAFPLIFLLNRRRLTKRYQASFVLKIFFAIAFIFFLFFVAVTLKNLF